MESFIKAFVDNLAPVSPLFVLLLCVALNEWLNRRQRKKDDKANLDKLVESLRKDAENRKAR